MLRNAFRDRLGRYISLTPEEKAALDGVLGPERRLKPGGVLIAEGDPEPQLYIIQHGWMHTSRRLNEGPRQIVRFHYAGDLAGTSSIAWNRAAATMTAISDCTVCDVTKTDLGRMMGAYPRLAALLYAVAAAEAVAMSDRLTSVGRTDARVRLVTLLLDIIARLRVTAGGIVDAFDLPLTQSDIADAVGLTSVHVNRTLRALERDGLIERHGRRVRILKEAEQAEAVGFVDRYAEVATDWLPPPGR